MNLVSGGIRIDAEIGVAHHVEVGLAGKPQGLAQSASQGGFEIEDQVGVVANRVIRTPGGVERADLRDLVLGGIAEAVGALVRRVERQAALVNDIGLAGEPPLGGFGVGEHRQHGIGGFGGGLRLSLGNGLTWSFGRELGIGEGTGKGGDGGMWFRGGRQLEEGLGAGRGGRREDNGNREGDEVGAAAEH